MPADPGLNDDCVVYLDLDFVSRKYEEKFGTDPQAKITKQRGGNAGISAYFANAGVSTQESRTYSITSRQMLHALWKQLEADYPKFEGFENYNGTKLVWMSGDLTLGEWRKAEAQEPGYEFFQLKKGEERTVFLANETYFSAGFARMLTASEVLKVNIGIPVVCLARVMWYADRAKNFVACPYVVIERSEGSHA
ncbi:MULTISPECIES: hypothetical protein [Rhodanobacter]|uniref:hypothetical protein n=1 Tax=Rhodanobacter TaxID=75309 RepID=UPI0019029F31|nr:MULTISPECIES: hypothetical protein [Rhodanobacter]